MTTAHLSQENDGPPWRKWIIVGGVVILLISIASYLALSRIPKFLDKRAVEFLHANFSSDVQFSSFHLVIFPHAQVTIKGLVLRHKGRTDLPPLIQATEVIVDAKLRDLLAAKIGIASVRLIGLQIYMPPRQPGSKPLIKKTDEDLTKKYPIVIDHIYADNALLMILRAQPEKEPREFDIHHLDVKDFAFDRPSTFHAILTNPIPKGEIDCTGEFGPWQAEEPSTLPLNAKFSLENADFHTIKGLSGTLSSTGTLDGPLDFLSVHGQTETPDFALNISGHPEPLHTDYDATVDGSNGDVILNNVLAKLHNSILHVKGEIIDLEKNVKGRTIKLDATSNDARIEDLIWLAVKSDEPIMTGTAKLKAKIEIAEGDADILHRLTIHGQFGVGDAKFTSATVQSKIDTLSKKAQGQPKAADLGTALSELNGAFDLAQGLITFSRLSFRVAGASVQLDGTYKMEGGEMDFRGKLLMDAKLSQTTTGVKSFFLKAVDPFFKGKNGGSEIPIKITGTKDHPTFGLNLHNK